MWQPTWSPHPPPGVHGAPLGPPTGTVAPPHQGVQPHTMVVAQPMNQQWMGNPAGSQGCPGNPSTLAPPPFYGPGPQGQSFVVQCKHHQGSYSIMQHQQPMMGTTSSSSPSPMGFGLGPQQAGYQGTTWSSFPTSTPLSQQVPQPPLDTSSNPQGHNPLLSPTPQPPSFTNFPPQPNQSLQHQPRPCLQTNIPVPTNPMAPNPQGVQGQPGLLGVPGQQALQAPPLPQGSPGPQSAHSSSVCQVPQVAQGQLPTQVPQAAQDPSHSAPTQQGTPPAQTSGNQPSNLVPPDLDTLEQRLGATLQKGIESLKSALTPTPTPTPTPMAPPPLGTSPSSFSPKPSTPTPTTAPIATPVKAKPPTPPTEPHQRATSPRLNQRFPLTRERPPSRKSRSRSRRRRRSRSKEAHTRGHRDSTRNAPPAYGSKGQDHSWSKQQSAPMRHTKPTLPKTPKSTPRAAKDEVHPTFRRSHAFHQVHQDDRSTIYRREHRDQEQKGRHTPRSTSPKRSQLWHPKESMISLRSRSRTRRSDQQDRQHSTGTGPIVLRPKVGRTQSHGWNQPDASASETVAESPQVEIPQIPPADLEADWRRPSQDREEEETAQEDKSDGQGMHQNDPSDQMMIPKHKSMDEDWGISVKKAFDDTSRTLAPCEIPAEKAVVLPMTISERGYNNFAAILSRQNPKAPRTVVENMTTIFAQSGKMSPEQAKGSYTFEVSALERFGLFVPTCFAEKPPFDGNGTYVYHIIHGTSPKGASTILAEEMIRPGDFDIKRDLAKCQYPSYGFYSAGEVASKNCRFHSNIEEISRKILKIGKGGLPVHMAGIYAGRHQHSNPQAGGNDEVQRLCGKYGVARGKEKYTVARSEHTTVIGTILFYKNQV